MRALKAVLPIPFLLMGGFLLQVETSPPDVVIVQGDNTPPTSIDYLVEICHKLYPDNPPNFQIIDIESSTLPGHLAHGDIYPVPESGICYTPPTTTIPVGTNPLTVPTTTTSTTLATTTTSSTTTSSLPGSTTSLPPTTAPSSTVPSNESTTTVAPIDSFDIGAASSICSRDVPFIDLVFGNEPQFNGLVGTITFRTLDGDFIEEIPLAYEANTTVRVVFPGASFDPVTGEATDWPGWRLNADGFWVTDPTDAEFRDGITVTAELPIPIGGLGQQVGGTTVTATATVTYPPETAACNSPEGLLPPTGTSTGRLPDTGFQTAGYLLLLVGIAIGLGNVFIQFGRKNHGDNR